MCGKKDAHGKPVLSDPTTMRGTKLGFVYPPRHGNDLARKDCEVQSATCCGMEGTSLVTNCRRRDDTCQTVEAPAELTESQVYTFPYSTVHGKIHAIKEHRLTKHIAEDVTTRVKRS